jgi:hypothetical protein
MKLDAWRSNVAVGYAFPMTDSSEACRFRPVSPAACRRFFRRESRRMRLHCRDEGSWIRKLGPGLIGSPDKGWRRTFAATTGRR